ncbi:MAG: EAL domain-containing protein, partial [Sulfurimonadaceae bacterium]|nr:EAL domain-containing protein [Sulfurimonadaceae bacterium]
IEKLQILFEKYTKISPSMIELEILETHALEEFSHIYKILQTCQNMGMKIALDDFGTGYSSLHYLKKFPLNIIKIDKSFVLDSLTQSSSLSIVDASLGLSRAFQCNVIAEGVESIEIGELLIQLGVSKAQGYAIAKPMDQKEVPAWMKSYKNHPKWLETKTLENENIAILYASVEHRNWFDKIERYFNKSEIELPTMNYKECYLGKWIDSDSSKIYKNKKEFKELKELHTDLHIIANKMLIQDSFDNDKFKELTKMREKILDKLQEIVV